MSNGIVIQQYEQQHVPNAVGTPTQSGPAPGETIGRAVAEFGGAMAGLGRANLELQDRNAKIEAAKILSDAEVMIAEQKQAAALALGDKDPTGFAGTFNEKLTTMREGIVGKAGDQQNPFLKQHLDAGFQGLQRSTFLDAMRIEYEATGKFRTTQLKSMSENAVKLVTYAPGEFEKRYADVAANVDTMTGVSAEWKAEAKKSVKATLATSAIMSITKTDSAKAMEIMKNKDDPLVSALDADQFVKLKEQVRVEFTTDEGKRRGDAIGLKAQSQADLLREVAKISDPDMRAFAEQAALQTYSQKTSADKERKDKAEENWYNKALATPDNPPPFPESMTLIERTRAMETLNTYRYVAQGGVTKSNPDTYMSLYTMMLKDPSAFSKVNLPQYRGGLSQGDFMYFQKQQAETAAGRTELSTQLNAKIQNALRQITGPVPDGAAAKQARKQQEFSFTQGFLAVVNARETELNRPLTAEEQDKELNKFVQFRATNPPEPWDPYGLVSGGDRKTFTQLVPGRYPELIPAQLKALGVDVSMDNMVKFYQGLDMNRDVIVDGLEDRGIDPTDDNIVAAYTELLRQK